MKVKVKCGTCGNVQEVDIGSSRIDKFFKVVTCGQCGATGFVKDKGLSQFVVVP